MPLNYDKIKEKGKEGGGEQWTSYSDLFMVLSFVFLLLYVVSSLRDGTTGLQNNLKQQSMAEELESLKQQLKVYETLKEDYMEKRASNQEQALYGELMEKLTLLKGEAKNEKEALRRQALENESKELALNKYQRMVRNIINANVIAQSRIKKRDDIISEKQQALYKKQKEIKKLNKTIRKKKEIIADNNLKIAQVGQNLERKIFEIRQSQKKYKTSKKKLAKKIALLRKKSKKEIKKLNNASRRAKKNLNSISRKLTSAEGLLKRAKKKILKQSKEKDTLSDALITSALRLKKEKTKHEREVKGLQRAHRKRMKREKIAFEKNLKRQKLSATEKERKIARFKKTTAKKEAKLKKRIGKLNSEYTRSRSELKKIKKKNQRISSRLKKVRKLANKKRRLAQKIKRNLSKEGIDAKINLDTGDVIISFGDDYFETGAFLLKSSMKKRIEKFIPIYASSLFNDKKIARSIKHVEIIGFASPTYRGKFVDPKSLSIKDRKAVSYNLDLSYKRAKSIFKYIFDTKKMKFSYQRNLLSRVKVTGRSFLAEEIKGRSIASGLRRREYCKKFDCKKSQRVIIKFNLKN